MSNDLEKFLDFFKTMGHTLAPHPRGERFWDEDGPDIINVHEDGRRETVPMYRKGDPEDLWGDMPLTTKSSLSIAQAIFCFDGNGRYLGAVADEMGYFQAREN